MDVLVAGPAEINELLRVGRQYRDAVRRAEDRRERYYRLAQRPVARGSKALASARRRRVKADADVAMLRPGFERALARSRRRHPIATATVETALWQPTR